jgi:hypothetical protein
MVGQLKGFKKVAKPEAGKEYCYPVAAVRAYLTIGKNFTFAQEIYVDFEKKLDEDFKATGIPSDVYERSIAFGDSIAASIVNYSKEITTNKLVVFAIQSLRKRNLGANSSCVHRCGRAILAKNSSCYLGYFVTIYASKTIRIRYD